MSDYESAQRRRDVIVGIFVICGLAALGWMIFKFGDLPTTVTQMRSFQVYVQFPTAPGVQKDTPVRFAGYQIGRVTHVMAPEVRKDLETGQEYHQTVCVLSINKRYVNIPSNVAIKLMTRGLGSSYIELKVDPDKLPAPPRDPNQPDTIYLQDGMLVQGSAGMTSEFFPEESQEKLNSLVEDIGAFISNANDIIGDDENKGNIKDTLAHLSEATKNASTAMEKATEMMADAERTLADFRTLATTGTETAKSVDAKAQRLVGALIGATGEVSRAVAQLRLALEKVNEGQGTAGKLVTDGKLYENLLESTEQLNVLLKDFKDLIDKVSEKGIRSIY
ncbi:MAG: MCE family protein [Sedimentisphaerales bacterium]|nr:MCE family protein [Sedimentisphaerales bacterium]